MSHHHVSHSIIKAAALCLAAAVTLQGCGGSGQDKGRASANNNQSFRGVVIDGYLARAMVFLDYDNNSTLDPWEPFAFTDDAGYYSFNPITNTDYCATDAPAELQIYCLKSKRSLTEAVIRVDGGYDVSTGEPFHGQLSRRISISSSGAVNNVVISPLTTLLTNVSSAEQKSAILSALGITEADLDVDYFNSDSASGLNHALLNAALKLHKTISVMNHFIGLHYEEIGNHSGTANDLTSSIYRHIANELLTQQISFNTLVASAESLENILRRTEADARNIYDQWDMDLPYIDINYAAVIEKSRALNEIIDQLVPADGTDVDQDNINGVAKLVETLVIKAMRAPYDSDDFNNAISFLQSSDNASLVRDLIDALISDRSDLDGLANRDFAGDEFHSSDSIREIAQLPSGTQAFSQIGGQQLRVSDMDLGFAPNNLNDSEVEFYFHGDSETTSGRFNACVKYIEDASSDGKLGDANTRGELVSGYWSLLGAQQNAGESYSLLLTIQFLGSTYQAILKPAGFAKFDDAEMQAIRFDYAGDLNTWYSANGFEPQGQLPTSNTDCAERLPSRIGI